MLRDLPAIARQSPLCAGVTLCVAIHRHEECPTVRMRAMAGTPLAHSPTLAAEVRAAPMRLLAGTAVGEYVLDEAIGAGAMGEVYAGHHPVIGKKVAIKVLRKELASSEDAAERFTRAARAVNQVDHPNVIDVFAYGR